MSEELNISGLLDGLSLDDGDGGAGGIDINAWKIVPSTSMPALDVLRLKRRIKIILSDSTAVGSHTMLVAMPNHYLTGDISKEIENAVFAAGAVLMPSTGDSLVINNKDGTKSLAIKFVMAWGTGKDRKPAPAIDTSNEDGESDGNDSTDLEASTTSSTARASIVETSAVDTSAVESSFESVGDVGFTQECFF